VVHFAFSGGLLPRKGVDVIFNGWNATHCRTDAAKLTVITSYELGYDETKLAEFEAIVTRCGNIKWHRGEMLSKAKYHGIMDTVDVYVGPSRGEGFGLPIVEAMARGQQIITTTGLGSGERSASDDFANNSTAYLVRATTVKCTMYPCTDDGQRLCVVPPCADGRCTCAKLARGATWLEPDALEMEHALVNVLADVRAGKARLRSRDATAIRQAYAWESEGFRTQYVKLLHGLSEVAATRGAVIPANTATADLTEAKAPRKHRPKGHYWLKIPKKTTTTATTTTTT
jgi:glycosyltransferase involved in cell wall biosynthesis